MDTARLALIWCRNGLGSGYLVAPRLVLTAGHVLCECDDADVWLAGTREWRANVVWRSSTALDACLLRLVVPAAGQPNVGHDHDAQNHNKCVNFARIPEGSSISWEGAGFPRALASTLGARESVGVHGIITAGGGVSRRVLELTVDNPPSSDEYWSGLSGIAVLVEDQVVGLVNKVLSRLTGRLHATRIERVIEELPVELRSELCLPGELHEVLTPARGTAELSARRTHFLDQTADIFRLMHYDVQTDHICGGRTVDLFLTGRLGDVTIRRIIQCLPAGGTFNDVEGFATTLRRARKEVPAVTGTIVLGADLPTDAAALAYDEDIAVTTLHQLDAQLMDGRVYAQRLLQEIHCDEKYRLAWHVEPLIGFDAVGASLPADQILGEWLSDSTWNQLTLLGDVGTGKTFLAHVLALRLAEAYLDDPINKPLPILVDLRNADRLLTVEGLITTHIQQRGLERMTFAAFQRALSSRRIVLLLDGFDEMAARVTPQITTRNFQELAKCVRGRAKVMLTCRTHYFKSRSDEETTVLGVASEYQSEAVNDLYWHLVTRNGFRIAYIRPFTASQIEEYVTRARPHDAKQSIGHMRQIYNLMELSQRPMLLDMIVKSIDRLEDAKINAAGLYQVFTSIWIGRDRWRDVLTPDRKLALLVSLALRLWASGAPGLHHIDLLEYLKDSEGRPRELATLLEIDNEMRTASFLVRDALGQYGFAHKSYAEFFIARHLSAELEAGRLECLAVPRRVSPEIVGFLVELVKLPDEVTKVLVDQLVEKYRPDVSENALLCLYGFRKMHARLANVGHFTSPAAHSLVVLPPGMQLEQANLESVILLGIQARSVNLRNAQLSGATLTGSDLTDGDLEGSNFVGAKLQRTLLVRARAARAVFAKSDLTGSVLEGADVSDADFSEAILVGSDRRDTHVEGANFSGAELGAPSAVGEVVARIVPLLKQYRFSRASDDAIQEIWIYIYDALIHHPNLDELGSDKDLHKFVRSAYDRQRWRESKRLTRSHDSLSPDVLTSLVLTDESPERVLQMRSILRSGLAALDSTTRLIIEAWIKGTSDDEIAASLGESVEGVVQRRRHGLARVRRAVAEDDDC